MLGLGQSLDLSGFCKEVGLEAVVLSGTCGCWLVVTMFKPRAIWQLLRDRGGRDRRGEEKEEKGNENISQSSGSKSSKGLCT